MLAYLVERAIGPPPDSPGGGVKPEAVSVPESIKTFLEGPVAEPSGQLGLSFGVARLLLAGGSVDDLARTEGMSPDAVRAGILGLASRPGAVDPLPALLRLVAEGRPVREARRELEVTDEQFTEVVRALMPADASVPSRFFPAPPLGAGPQRVVPVRFPETQYERLKAWCTVNGFPMAAVVRGLVERFLDDQDRRAA